jgi:hypothetical protein
MAWDQPRSQYVPTYWKREILPCWLTLDGADVPGGTLAIPAFPTQGNPRPFKQPYFSCEGLDQNLGTPFEIQSLVFADLIDGTAAANFTVRLKEVGEAREFMNRACHVRTLFGTAQTPALLREPYYFLSQHNISIQCNKIVGGATSARFYMVGNQYYPWSPEFIRKPESRAQLRALMQRWLKRRRGVTPYWLTTDTPVDLLANATGEFSAKIGDDGSVELFTMAAVATGNFHLQISEVKTKQLLMNAFITQQNGIGTANFPTLLPVAYMLPAGYRLRIVIRDASGFANSVHLTFGGRKIYAGYAKKFLDGRHPSSVPTPADDHTEMVPAPLLSH